MSLLKRLQQGEGGSQPATPPGAQTPDGANRSSAMPTRRVPPPPTSPQQDTYQDLKTRVQNKLLAEIDLTMDVSKTAEVRRTIQELFEQILNEENIVISRPERSRLFEQISAEILGLGPIQILLEDDSITEIMVNGAKNIYVERGGKVFRAPVTFESNEHVMRILDRIVSPLGRRIDESSPYVDARLPDGSRVNAVIPPISLVGPVITIRKFSRNPITVDQLIKFGTISLEAVTFLEACVKSRVNIVISGGTGSGKTTLLNVLSGYIPVMSVLSLLKMQPSCNCARNMWSLSSPARRISKGAVK